MIGIICALDIEADGLKALMENPETTKKAGLEFTSGKIFDKDVAVLASGRGKVNSAVGALVEADPTFEAWLNVLGNCRFYPAAKAEWADVRNGVVVDVEQRALTGEEVKPLLDALQTKIAGE